MKTTILIAAFFLGMNHVKANNDEKIIKTKPEKVIVYANGAQVFRQAQLSLPAGENKIAFDRLEEGISANSLQVGGNGNFIITETAYGDKLPDLDNYKGDLKYVKYIKQLKDSLELLDYKAEELANRREVLNTEKTVLLNFKLFKGEARKDSISFLKEGMNYLQEKLTIIYSSLHMLKKEGETLTSLRQNLQARLYGIQNDLGNMEVDEAYKTNHRVVVTILCEIPMTAVINLNYFVSTAGWEPAYDLRTEGVEQPVKVTYKGLVYQHTGIDWSNVRLILSTGRPACNVSAPELYSWYLDGYRMRALNGKDKKSEVTTLSVPMAFGVSQNELDESKAEEKNLEQPKESFEYVEAGEQFVQATFEIKLPYSIASDNKKHTVEVLQKELDARYMYKSVPKQDLSAYLLARVTGWEDLNLSAGKANVFYAGTYVGQTYINPSTTKDTLDLTLGKDDNVVVSRIKQKDKNKEKVFNNDKVYSFAYEITVRNGNAKTIEIEIKDQLPLSHSKDISIVKDRLDNADYNEATGILTWRQTIKPKDTKHIDFAYTVKAPKDLPIAIR